MEHSSLLLDEAQRDCGVQPAGNLPSEELIFFQDQCSGLLRLKQDTLRLVQEHLQQLTIKENPGGQIQPWELLLFEPQTFILNLPLPSITQAFSFNKKNSLN